jgi:ribonuclease P protein component
MCATAIDQASTGGARSLTFGWSKKLRKTDEFSSVFRFRCAHKGVGLDIMAGPNGLPFPRLGLIVPKRIVSTAVGRNRIKRLLREWFRLGQVEYAGLDVIARLKAMESEGKLKDEFLNGLMVCKSCVGKRATTVANQN